MAGQGEDCADEYGIDVINAYAKEHHGGVLTCRYVEGKGRTLWATEAFEPGGVIMTEPPLIIVQLPISDEPSENSSGEEQVAAAAYRELADLCHELKTDHSPLWYWCALRSLTEAELGAARRWEPLGEPQQRLLLMLHQAGVVEPSAAVLRIRSHFALEDCDALKLERCLQAWFNNAFDHVENDQPGYAIYFFPSFMSHSCWPNAIWYLRAHEQQEVRACQPVAAGDEVVISYLDEDTMVDDAPARRQLLFRTKSFWCACERCAGEYDLSRGMECPSCQVGNVFAHCPHGSVAPLLREDAEQFLRPLRPSTYSDVSAWDLSLWLTMGAPALKRSSGRFYYEVKLGRGCQEPQIGWATGGFEEVAAWNGSGVGDDEHSWGADGVRHSWWHNGPQDCADERWSRDWLEGDVVGCAIDIDSGEMAFSENGSWKTAADFTFEAGEQSFYPAISMQGDFTLHLDSSAFEFRPLDESFKPLIEEPSARAGPVDRWSPLPGAFAGSLCQKCGSKVDVEESRRLARVERSAQRTVDDWDGRDLAREAGEANALLAGSLSQHVLLDKARVKLAKFHELQGRLDDLVGVLHERCEFHAAAYPGLSCGHAWALQEYGDAVAERAKERFTTATGKEHEATIAQMQEAKACYSRALSTFSTCFGTESEATSVCAQSKIDCAARVLEVMQQEVSIVDLS